MHAAKRLTDDDICRAAIAAGASDATVFKVKEHRHVDGRPIDTEWLVLSVLRDGQREIVGRRRTRAELLELAKRVPVRASV